jgi:hypothetical protein
MKRKFMMFYKMKITKYATINLKEPIMFTIVTGPRIDLAIDLIDRDETVGLQDIS